MFYVLHIFQDMEIPVLISQSFQMSGLHKEALQAAELVLKQVIIDIDLVLVSTAVQRLHLSEFDFYFKFASTFMSPDTFSSTGPK